ncbi:MAG TPA: mannosyltransferase family protein [Gaiellaceae bacterium]|nr:mannosyltransferase family protein [Gaiellaceae bacterium]
MGLGLRALTRLAHPALRPAWTLVGIRLAYLLATALTLLWQLPRFSAVDRDLRFDEFRAYGGLSDWLFNVFTQWDAGWYLNIAGNGYGGEQAAAFFPVYPAAVALVAVVTRSLVVAGVLVSLVAAGIAAVCLERIGRQLVGPRPAGDAVLLLATYPVAFVFTSVYPEGLFLAFATGSTLAALRGRSWTAGILGALAVGTRAIGLALVPMLALLLWRGGAGGTRRALARLAPLVLLPAAVGLFALHLRDRIDDPWAFLSAQEDFWGRHTPALGPLGGLWEAFDQGRRGAMQILLHLPRAMAFGFSEESGSRNALHLLLLAAMLWLTWEAWRRLGPAFGLYSAVYLAVILSAPVEGFPLVSLPRFALGDFPLFLALAAVLDGRPRARSLVLYAFVAVGAMAAVGFARHAWVA